MVVFKVLLLNHCQKEFERDIVRFKQKDSGYSRSTEELIASLRTTKSIAKKRFLGTARLLGELVKIGLLTKNVIHDCLEKLLACDDEVALECLCVLISTLGNILDGEQSKVRMDLYFTRIGRILTHRRISPRVRFMLLEISDLRRNKWVPRRDTENPTTIQQIHREARGKRKLTNLFIPSCKKQRLGAHNSTTATQVPSQIEGYDWQTAANLNMSVPARRVLTNAHVERVIKISPGGRFCLFDSDQGAVIERRGGDTTLDNMRPPEAVSTFLPIKAENCDSSGYSEGIGGADGRNSLGRDGRLSQERDRDNCQEHGTGLPVVREVFEEDKKCALGTASSNMTACGRRHNGPKYTGASRNQVGARVTPKGEVEPKPLTPRPLNRKRPTPKPVDLKPLTPRPWVLKPLTPRPLDLTTLTSRPVHLKRPTPRQVDLKNPTPRPVDLKRPPPRQVDLKPLTPRTVDLKPLTPRPVDLKPLTPRPVDLTPLTPRPVDLKPLTAKAVDLNLLTPRPVDLKPSTPSPVHIKPRSPRTLEIKPMSPTEELLEAELKKITEATMDANLHQHDLSKAMRCVKALESPTSIHVFVYHALSLVQELSEAARSTTGTFLQDLVVQNIITVDQYTQGLKEFLEFVEREDMDCTIPSIWENLGKLISPLVVTGAIPLSCLRDACAPLVRTRNAELLLGELLNDLCDRLGPETIGDLWSKSGLQLSDFLPIGESTPHFITKYGLEFTPDQPLRIDSHENRTDPTRLTPTKAHVHRNIELAQGGRPGLGECDQNTTWERGNQKPLHEDIETLT